MTAAWEVNPVRAEPGDAVELRIIDREAGSGGRTVCVIQGNLIWRAAENNFVRLLDEDDIANAVLLAHAQQLKSVVSDLLAWAQQMGGWDATCWREAEAILRNIKGGS
jgi:hypothetical protein